MDNVVQDLRTSQRMASSSSDDETLTATGIDAHLRLLQMNWFLQKICNERILEFGHRMLSAAQAPVTEAEVKETTEECRSESAEKEECTPAAEPHSPKPTSEEPQPQGAAALGNNYNASEGRATAKPDRHSRVKVRFNPYDLRRKSGDILSAVTLDGPLEIELKYHENMARSFVDLEKRRTPEEQQRRDRNSEAARLSRAKRRALQGLLEKEFDEVAEQNRNCKRAVAQKRVYVRELRKLLGLPEKDLPMDLNMMAVDDDDAKSGEKQL